jgi:hypothetical protein
VLTRYSAMEEAARVAVQGDMAYLSSLLAPGLQR